MRRDRQVKIVATLGPASSAQSVIAELYAAGVDVFRINMSHTDHPTLVELVGRIRAVEAEVGRPIGILADLQGPKFRVGTFADGKITLAEGAPFTLDTDPAPGDETRVMLPHPEIFTAVKPGDRLLLDDGRVSLVVDSCDRDRIVTRVVAGSALSDRKGVSLPDTEIELSALTAKDRNDLDAALAADVDWIALSFIQRADDLIELRRLTEGRAWVMAKIEKPQALGRLADIIDNTDALMVARGDLGVELPLERVPGLQKQITRAARRAGKPVVVATQMLESMVTAAVPTRAEVSDVATAVFEGADAVMLSAESATGAHPVEAVSMIDRIAVEVERDPNYRSILDAQRYEPEPTGPDAISAAARQIAETLGAKAICCYTSSGATGIRAARERPQTPIIALSPVTATARRLSLVWGLHCEISEDARDPGDMVDRACRIVREQGFAAPGEQIIITAGVPFGTPGATNLLRVAEIKDDS